MSAVDLTSRFVQSIKPSASPFDVFDKRITGLGIRISPGGKKTFFVRYRNTQGRVRKVMLGSTIELSLSDARAKARETLVEVNKGSDPQATLKRERVGETLAEVAELFVAYSRDNNRPSTAAEDERCIRKELLPTLGNWKIKDIRRRDIIQVLEKVKFRNRGKKIGAPIAANRLHQIISRIFEFAVNRDITDTNPVYRLRKLTKERPRTRILSEGELRRLLAALENESDDLLGGAIRLIIMLARRRSEVFAWRWEEIERGIWTIPAHRSKNKRAIPVPLPTQAVELLETLKSLPNADPTGYVFPSPTKPGSYYANPKKSFATIRSGLEIENFTIHDLRRTAATRMRSLEILREDVEAILGHAEGRLIETYQVEFPIERMRRGLQIWADYLDTLRDTEFTENSALSNVIPLRVRAG